jgi:hypothetical protein
VGRPLPATVGGLRVRAFCGGRFSPYGNGDTGAALHGWDAGATASAGPAWRELARNSAPVSAAGLVEWSAASAAEARRFVLERDRSLAFQCRPVGGSGLGDAQVSRDYVEVRVRYTLAP